MQPPPAGLTRKGSSVILKERNMQPNNHVFAMGLTAAAALLGITVDSLGDHSGDDATAVQEALRELRANGSPATIVAVHVGEDDISVYANGPGIDVLMLDASRDDWEDDVASELSDDNGDKERVRVIRLDPILDGITERAAAALDALDDTQAAKRTLTQEQREELIELLMDDALDDLAQSDAYATAVLEFGNIGFRQMSDTRLLKIHSDRWDEDFLAEDEDDDEEEEAS